MWILKYNTDEHIYKTNRLQTCVCKERWGVGEGKIGPTTYYGSTSLPWQVSEPLPLLFPLLWVPLPSHLQGQILPVSTDLPHKLSKGLRAGSTVACWSEHPWPFLPGGPHFSP